VKRSAALLLLLFWVGIALGQTPGDLIELEIPALADSAWKDFYRELDALGRNLRLDGRLYLNDSSRYSLHSLGYELANESLIINHKHDWENGDNHFNFQLAIRSQGLEAVLGAYRFRFGRGILTGSGSRSAPDSLFSILKPTSPSTYVPLGVAAKFRRGPFRAALLGSMQERKASISDGEVTNLPATKLDLLGSVKESVFGGTLGYISGRFRGGALLYWQHYGKPFADDDLDQGNWSASLAAAMDHRAHSLDAELAYLKSRLHGLISWEYKLKSFTQTLSYAKNPSQHQLAYALTPAVLDASTGRDELSYGLDVALPFKTRLQMLYTLNSGSGFSGGLLSRLKASLRYSEAGNSLGLTFYSFDREIISLVDSTYEASLPRNYRFLFSGRYQFRPDFYQQFDFTYSLRDLSDYTKNTYRTRITLGYDLGKLRLKTGILSWQSPGTFIFPDELSPQYYSVCTSEDTAVFASASRASGNWRVSALAQKSIIDRQDYRIHLRLGFSAF